MNVFWFRRDLRIDDNKGLYDALTANEPVKCVFIFDTEILDKLERGPDRRISFIYDRIVQIKKQLIAAGSDLFVFHGKPVQVWTKLIIENQISKVYFNVDYDAYSLQRDSEIVRVFSTKDVVVVTSHDHVLLEPSAVLKDNGTPYSVFTPFSKKWNMVFGKNSIKEYPSDKHLGNLLPVEVTEEMLPYEILGFERASYEIIAEGLSVDTLHSYLLTRNRLDIDGTSRISACLRFGTMSIRKIFEIAQQTNAAYVNELIWREFYQMILYNFPQVENSSFKPKYEQIEWLNNEQDFDRWSAGETGYPVVDAAMHQLNETGWMHNRARMIVSSFLTKHLLIDWRWGEAYFASKLVDHEIASNNGGWQWAAGSGCDAAPYFRIFNPYLQQKKFDVSGGYVQQWRGNTGLKPVVEHGYAVKRCIFTYKKALADVVY